MGAAFAFKPRQAFANDCATRDHCRARIAFRQQHRSGNRVDLMSVGVDHLPAGDPKSRSNILGNREFRMSVVGHPVVVPEKAELAEAQVAREGNDLVCKSLLQTAVAYKRPSAMVDYVVAESGVEPGFGNGHTHRVGDALPERTGRDFDAQIRGALGMAMRMRAQFAESLDLLDRKPSVA